jgi:hypothetical protein
MTKLEKVLYTAKANTTTTARPAATTVSSGYSVAAWHISQWHQHGTIVGGRLVSLLSFGDHADRRQKEGSVVGGTGC